MLMQESVRVLALSFFTNKFEMGGSNVKIKKGLLLGTSLLILAISQTNVNAYVENPLKQRGKDYTKSIIATLSEEDEAVELLNHNIVLKKK